MKKTGLLTIILLLAAMLNAYLSLHCIEFFGILKFVDMDFLTTVNTVLQWTTIACFVLSFISFIAFIICCFKD